MAAVEGILAGAAVVETGEKEPLFAVVILVLSLIATSVVCWKMITGHEARMKCIREHVNLIERDLCFQREKARPALMP